MPSPFPGMDPYLESQGFWQDFHFRLIAQISDALSAQLPTHYAALIEERVSLVDLSGEASPPFRPDVVVVEQPVRGPSRQASAGASVVTLEPVTLPLAWDDLDEVIERWITIRRLPDRQLVTVIEILSPANKVYQGRDDYLYKRKEILRQPVHLVEIDLLLQGHRIPFRTPLPLGDYFAYVTRAVEPRETCDVYAWPISRPLPSIPVPLSAPDPDVQLDLGALVSRSYDQGRYGRLVDYDAKLDVPIDAETLGWIEQVVRDRR